jgi:lactobin A/cerein 7B family class IIb bacteriocin
MATIKIFDLQPSSSDLFSDSKNYINKMSEKELSSIKGGCGFWCSVGASLVAAAITDFGNGFVDGLNGK